MQALSRLTPHASPLTPHPHRPPLSPHPQPSPSALSPQPSPLTPHPHPSPSPCPLTLTPIGTLPFELPPLTPLTPTLSRCSPASATSAARTHCGARTSSSSTPSTRPCTAARPECPGSQRLACPPAAPQGRLLRAAPLGRPPLGRPPPAAPTGPPLLGRPQGRPPGSGEEGRPGGAASPLPPTRVPHGARVSPLWCRHQAADPAASWASRHCEDVDLSARVILDGHRILFCPHARSGALSPEP